MKTKYWENEELFTINRDVQKMIIDKEAKTIVSFSFTYTSDKYSAILIYK